MPLELTDILTDRPVSETNRAGRRLIPADKAGAAVRVVIHRQRGPGPPVQDDAMSTPVTRESLDHASDAVLNALKSAAALAHARQIGQEQAVEDFTHRSNVRVQLAYAALGTDVGGAGAGPELLLLRAVAVPWSGRACGVEWATAHEAGVNLANQFLWRYGLEGRVPVDASEWHAPVERVRLLVIREHAEAVQRMSGGPQTAGPGVTEMSPCGGLARPAAGVAARIAVHADGPAEPYTLWWAGSPREFGKDERRYFRLLTVMWPVFATRGHMKCDEVNKALVALGASKLSTDTLKNYALGLSTVLDAIPGFPSRIVKDDIVLRWTR